MKGTMISNLETTVTPASQDFARLVDLQQKFNAASLALETLEVAINKSAQHCAAENAAAYCVHQEELATLDAAIKVLFANHPEWRGDAKSIKTPYGSVEQRKVTELEVPNPAMTVALIEGRGAQDKAFDVQAFLRIEKEPNIEALESLTDDELAKLGCRRVSTDRVTVKPAKINAAKAVKAARKESKS